MTIQVAIIKRNFRSLSLDILDDCNYLFPRSIGIRSRYDNISSTCFIRIIHRCKIGYFAILIRSYKPVTLDRTFFC